MALGVHRDQGLSRALSVSYRHNPTACFKRAMKEQIEHRRVSCCARSSCALGGALVEEQGTGASRSKGRTNCARIDSPGHFPAGERDLDSKRLEWALFTRFREV